MGDISLKAICFIGFMGAGKTTIGKEVAAKANLEVFDTDHVIESELKMTIKEIFESMGENEFRNVEAMVLRELLQRKAIITTGGGIVERKENRRILREQAFVIYLYSSFDELWGRLENDRDRPLIVNNNRDNIFERYNSRLSLYKEAADVTIDTTNKQIPEILFQVEQAITSFKN